jgi:hypothetical protein
MSYVCSTELQCSQLFSNAQLNTTFGKSAATGMCSRHLPPTQQHPVRFLGMPTKLLLWYWSHLNLLCQQFQHQL